MIRDSIKKHTLDILRGEQITRGLILITLRGTKKTERLSLFLRRQRCRSR